MKLRFLYQEIQRKLKRHNNYILVKTTLEKSFDLVKLDESTGSEQICAICWEKMKSARKLSCGHLFHL
jgi:autocrine motility factor receptor